MTLHEQITGADLGVFLDLDDFAEIHDVNGVKCRAVLQEISAEDLSGTHYEVYRDLMQVHCRARTCRRFPVRADLPIGRETVHRGQLCGRHGHAHHSTGGE